MTEIVAPFVNFGVVAFVLWHYGRKPLADFFANRSKTIGDAVAEGEKLSQEARSLLNEWEKNWGALEAHAEQARRDAQTAMAKFRESTLKAAKVEAERIRKDGTLAAQGEITRLKKELAREIATLSVRSASAHLKSELEETDRRKMVTETMEGLKNGQAG